MGLDPDQDRNMMDYASQHPGTAIPNDGFIEAFFRDYYIEIIVAVIALFLIAYYLNLYLLLNDKRRAVMKGLTSFLFVVISIVQMAAIIGGFNGWLGWNIVVSVILAMILTWFPLVGAALGIMGAINSWGWEWWQALLLFAWPVVLVFFSGAGGMILGKFSNR